MGGWAGPGAAQGGETTKVEIWSEFERLNLVPRYELVAGSVSKGGVPRLILSESTRTQTIEPYLHFTILAAAERTALGQGQEPARMLPQAQVS